MLIILLIKYIDKKINTIVKIEIDILQKNNAVNLQHPPHVYAQHLVIKFIHHTK